MSETDDTDDLLLIPPDFYTIQSSLEDLLAGKSDYYSVFDSLILQVSNLESRLSNLEISSNLSILSDMESQSAQSTPQKPKTKPRLSSLPNSPNVNRFASSPKKISPLRTKHHSSKVGVFEEVKQMGDHIISEVDSFLSNVKTIRKISAIRNLNSDFEKLDTQAPLKKVKAADDVEQILQEMDIQRMENEAQKQLNQLVGLKKAASMHEVASDKNFIPIRESRSEVFSEKLNPIEINCQGNAPTAQSSFALISRMLDRKSPIDDELHSLAQEVVNKHKVLSSKSSVVAKSGVTSNAAPDGSEQGKELKDVSGDSNLGLLSLTTLWTRQDEKQKQEEQIAQKLQEEQLRRKHCETLIVELQNLILEQQQKLAVALKVDEKKDTAILKFHDAWETMKMKYVLVNREREELEEHNQMLQKIRQKEIEDVNQKTSFYEKELTRLLTLAQDYQSKIAQVEDECAKLRTQLAETQEALRKTKENYEVEATRNKQLSDILANKEIDMIELKDSIAQARREVSNSKIAITTSQNEMTGIKSEYLLLKKDLEEEKIRSLALKKDNEKLLGELDHQKAIQKNLEDELVNHQKQLETNKLELRNFYQGQVELVVANKLKEFQEQLDQSERRMKEELKKRELEIAQVAAGHIKEFVDKQTLEVKLLEEKHQEEIQLRNIQLSKCKQEIEEMKERCRNHQIKSAQVAQKLKKLMEAQWMEALNIISAVRTPPQKSNDEMAIEQLNSLKHQSYNNLDELLSQNVFEEWGENAPARKRPVRSKFFMESTEKSVEPQDNQLHMDTPVSSKFKEKPSEGSRTNLHKYIDMLLQQKSQQQQQQEKDTKSLPEKDQNQAEHELGGSASSRSTYHDSDERKLQAKKERKLDKPPWK